MNAQMTTRSLPASLAPIVEELELLQPAVVTRARLAEIAAGKGIRLDSAAIAERLVRHGWLLPLRKRNTWEFAPAARAGPIRSGDAWIELRALLQHDPSAPVAIAFESAVWELGYSTQKPTTPVLAHRRGWRPPRSLSDVRSITFDWRLPTAEFRGLPGWQPATIVVAAANRPAAQGNWRNADDWLPETFRATTPDDVVAEAFDRGTPTLARLGYMAEWSGRYDIADRIAQLLPGRPPVTYFGDRRHRERWIARWRVYDALLPNR